MKSEISALLASMKASEHTSVSASAHTSATLQTNYFNELDGAAENELSAQESALLLGALFALAATLTCFVWL